MSPSKPQDVARNKDVSVTDVCLLRRLAMLIGDGEVPFPTDRSDEEKQILAQLVRHRRRSTLLGFLASRVAHDLLQHAEDSPAIGDQPPRSSR